MQQPDQPAPGPRIEVRARLIQQQHRRLHRQHRGDRHRPLLTAGEPVGRAVPQVRGPDPYKGLVHPLLHPLRRQSEVQRPHRWRSAARVLLGPEAAFLVIASVLAVQALFFADGGLLALGSNIFNLGVFPAFIAYPLVYRPVVGDQLSPTRVVIGSITGSIVGLSLGAMAVVLQTTFSGISDLPFGTFVALMLPIHLAIAIVEGLITAVVVLYVARLQPEILTRAIRQQPLQGLAIRRVISSLAIAAVLTGVVLAWFASGHPDGLEWSISGVTGQEEFNGTPTGLKNEIASVQEQTAFLPDYDFKPVTETPLAAPAHAGEAEAGWGAPSAGKSLAGLVGAGLTLLAAGSLGLVLRGRG